MGFREIDNADYWLAELILNHWLKGASFNLGE